MPDSSIDPFTLAVVHSSLIGVARDMKIMTMRTAYTELWKEQGDLSCCLMDAAGDIVAQDPNGFPVHVTTMPLQLKGTVAALGGAAALVPGDVLATNDPYIGGTHLPDVLIARPLFHTGTLYGYACSRGHWADIGGMGPGSYSPATSDIHQEGMFIPPVKLFDAGRPNEGVLAMIMANVRNRSVGFGDLRAQYAACSQADSRLQSLIARYGFDTIRQAMVDILDLAETHTRARIANFPDGVYHARDCLDGDGNRPHQVWIDARVTIAGSEIEVDLTGCDPQSSGGINCSHSAAESAVQFAVKIITDPENPPNAGSYRPIRVVTRPATVVDAQRPASMVGFGEVAYRVMDATLAALAPAIGDRAIASGSGSTGTVVISGRTQRANGDHYFTTIELSSGAHGGHAAADGANAMRYGPGNAGSIPIEVDEMTNPLRFEAFEITPDTGGAGRFRGGNGFRRVFRILADEAQICLCTDRHATPPPGLAGGAPGTCSRYVIDPGTERERVLGSKTGYIRLEKGALVWLQSAGAGGYGPAAERDPSRLQFDLREGYVTPAGAKKSYCGEASPTPAASAC